MRLLAAIFAILPLVASAVHHEWVVDEFYHSGGGGVIAQRVRCSICGAGNNPVSGVSGGWCTCHNPPRSVLVRSFSLGSSDEDDPESTEDRVNSLNGALSNKSGEELGALDWSKTPVWDMEGGGWEFGYLPAGTVVNGGSGIVSANSDGSGGVVIPVVDGSASGYDNNGNSGSWSLNDLGDGQYGSQWSPSWNGGATDDSSWVTPNNPDLPLSSDQLPVIPLDENGNLAIPISEINGSFQINFPGYDGTGGDGGGGGGDGGSGGGGEQGSSPQTIVPPVNVEVNINTHDYSGVLTAILNGIYSGFDRQYAFLLNLDQNLRHALDSTTAPDVAQEENPSVDTSSVSSEVEEQLDLVRDSRSGWGFDFGFGSNPIGNFITGLIGNPPTNFGSQDEVCDIRIPLWGNYAVQYKFKLSDWFPSAFRSCVLFILSIFFAIAVAKAVSGAFQ